MTEEYDEIEDGSGNVGEDSDEYTEVSEENFVRYVI